ncbi:LamG-like jellyroll fold domain-containing protein [Leptospira ellisii]|uniref:Glucanase n=1 Tax=Leptospira ellisii TaxID=2023197 RepID=A0A2N0B904_9LEPT|nr:LamG-like jellyroll fold domain-containing protein [Leptospira ellisii]MDV6236170.1 LamG-like jellyroll fold domain-containing protein [Leptospira ellisii]PJZ93025.1 glucanase [Leptospira ellisii]PKA04505.1 glucanase [Leptospira ellisii]
MGSIAQSKPKNFLAPAWILFLSLFTSIHSETKNFSFGELKRDGLELSGKTVENQILRLQTKERSSGADLYLNFDSGDPSDLKDLSGNYKVLSSSYLSDSENVLHAKKSARFSGKRTGIRIAHSRTGLLTSSDLTEEFYISFSVLPGTVEKDATLISKLYETSGNTYGWDLKIADDKLKIGFYSFFETEEKRYLSLRLSSNTTLRKNQWNRILLYFNPSENEIVLYQNGKEAARGSIPPNKNLTRIGFHPEDTTSFRIAGSYYGWMENFGVFRGKPNPTSEDVPFPPQEFDPETHTAKTKFGAAVSPVYKSRYSGSFLEEIQLRGTVPVSSAIELYLRVSPVPFTPSAEAPAWIGVDLRKLESYKLDSLDPDVYRIPLKDSLKKFLGLNENKDDLLPFRYYQWRIKFKSDSAGNKTPELKRLAMVFRETIPPVKPIGLKVAENSVDDSGPSVCLSWKSNPEREVIQGGGYFIHYGIHPDRMVGIIRGTFPENAGVPDKKSRTRHPASDFLDPITGLPPGKTAFNIQEYYNKLTTCVDNRIISLNSEILLEKNQLFLKKGTAYYFRIGAYNRFYHFQTGKDQMSPLSDAVEVYFLSE